MKTNNHHHKNCPVAHVKNHGKKSSGKKKRGEVATTTAGVTGQLPRSGSGSGSAIRPSSQPQSSSQSVASNVRSPAPAVSRSSGPASGTRGATKQASNTQDAGKTDTSPENCASRRTSPRLSTVPEESHAVALTSAPKSGGGKASSKGEKYFSWTIGDRVLLAAKADEFTASCSPFASSLTES